MLRFYKLVSRGNTYLLIAEQDHTGREGSTFAVKWLSHFAYAVLVVIKSISI